MADKDQEPNDGVDDFDKTARISFSDYPSTSVVTFAALSSGLGDGLQVAGPQARWSARRS